MVSANCHKTLFGRLVFDGIPVARDGEGGDASQNAMALNLCLDILKKGGAMDIFPEGTSSLGPKHLPFKSGAARILAAYLETGGAITVLPIGLHYQRAWAFRSKVELAVGDPINLDLEKEITPHRRMRTLHQRMGKALESVGINVVDEPELELVERLACLATLDTKQSYFKALKVFECGVPEDLRRAWADLEKQIKGHRTLRFQGVPLMPYRSPSLGAMALLVMGSFALAALLMNLPPFLAAWWAGKKLANRINLIALYRLLAGALALTLWSGALAAFAWVIGRPWWILAWAFITAVGIKSWYPVKQLTVTLHNTAACGFLREPMHALRARVLEHVRQYWA